MRKRPKSLLEAALALGWLSSMPAALTQAAPAPAQQEQAASATATPAQLEALRAYIRSAWKDLTRSSVSLWEAALDPKFKDSSSARLYIPASEDLSRLRAGLWARLPPGQRQGLELRTLPTSGPVPPGLLYLPKPYVVPGGRFNELYGWDSYFIILGLLRDGQDALAQDMADDLLYEVERYGKVLNANRTYYLTRSQPPLLSRVVLAVFGRSHDRVWLARALPALERYHRYWTAAPHLDPATGLSRYHDSGSGPAPEVLAGERDAQGRTHYDRVRQRFDAGDVPLGFDVSPYFDRRTERLTERFFESDRAMRESGFDPSDRFGPAGAGTPDFDPVCLNSLLFRMEEDLAEIADRLGQAPDARRWRAQARLRRRRVNRMLWDESDGLYYDLDSRRGLRRRYPFATTFFPLWTGLADARRARRVAANLSLFERPGGLMTSTRRTGQQWDAPFGWAPLQWAAAEGLRRYGFAREADRLSVNFLSLVLQEFLRRHVVLEKYDVVARRGEVASGLRFGYASNEIGFGWTNAVFQELWARLPRSRQGDVLSLDGVGVPRPRP